MNFNILCNMHIYAMKFYEWEIIALLSYLSFKSWQILSLTDPGSHNQFSNLLIGH